MIEHERSCGDYCILTIDGRKVTVDTVDVERLRNKPWRVDVDKRNVYFRYTKREKLPVKQKLMVYLHRFILNAAPWEIVDHKNGNTLDNRKSNLRFATRSGNARNRKTESGNRCGITGIRYGPRNNSYRVRVTVNNKELNIGSFSHIMIAEYELMKAVNKYHGDFSRYKRR
jgi:hypothetical protein